MRQMMTTSHLGRQESAQGREQNDGATLDIVKPQTATCPGKGFSEVLTCHLASRRKCKNLPRVHHFSLVPGMPLPLHMQNAHH